MTKSELIQKLAERNPHLFLRDIEKIVDAIFEDITQALVRGDRVTARFRGLFDQTPRRPHRPQPAHRRNRRSRSQAPALL